MNDEEQTFRGQREDEKLLLLIHRHPWALAKQGLIISLGVAVLIIIALIFQFSGPTVVMGMIIGIVLLSYGGYSWFNWWNNMYLITDQRVIVIVQSNFWSRQIEDYSLDKIQSVASSTAGMFGTLLNFGSVKLAIMGIKDQVDMQYIEDPYSVQEQILTAIKKSETVTINQYGEKHADKPEKKRRLIQH
jgi:uncharacterized membrane protein YdbT with pleckstrin-like domain